VLEGAIEHKDTTGTGAVLGPGEVQRMSAGTGIAHSEFNASKTEPLHFLQIWIKPGTFDLAPSYEQKEFPAADRRDRLRLVGSQDARDGSVTIHQDVNLYASLLAAGQTLEHELAEGRVAWLQLARGAVDVSGDGGNVSMKAGDGLAVSGERRLRLAGRDDAELLLFDLRRVDPK
jgi:redox-sensitive bicupin YhaK (pirin superfamily)